jgi:flagellar protein FliS
MNQLAKKSGPNPYLKAKLMSASPGQIKLMLLDGAVRFAEQGRVALLDERLEESCDLIGRARKIVVELGAGLRPDKGVDLAGKLGALYDFAHLRLLEANIDRDVAKLDEAISIIRYQRDTWQQAMDKLADAGETKAIAPPPTPAAPRLSLCA